VPKIGHGISARKRDNRPLPGYTPQDCTSGLAARLPGYPQVSDPAGPLHLRGHVDILIWPAWIEVAAGGLGVAWALSTFTRPQPSRELNLSRWGLLIFGAFLVLVGLIRMFGL